MERPGIELEAFRPGDFEQLISWVSSPRFALQWSGGRFSYPLDVEQLTSHLAGAGGEHPTLLVFKAVDAQDSAMVGYCELSRIEWAHLSGVVSHVLVDPNRVRGGVGSEMLRHLTDFGFGELGLHRMELFAAKWNTAAIRCYERAGFVHEGVHRDERRFGSEYWCIVHMSMLENEWRQQRQSTGGVDS